MKTSKSIIAIIALAIVATTAAFVSCKKERVLDTCNQSQDAFARIKDFKRQLEEIGLNPNERSVSYMSISDAVWNLEALFNYTYAYPGYVYGQTVCCDTTLYLPVCTNDSVSLADLYVFNGQMYEAVLALYQAVDLDNKQLVILDVEAGERNGNLQAIELHTVQGSVKGEPNQPEPPQMWEPFEEGVLWYYGEGHENSNGVPVDAADTLTGMLNAVLVKKAPEGSEYIYTNIKTKGTELGENYQNPYTGYPNVTPRYCEFYKEDSASNDYWLNSDQMNYYYFGERYLVLNILPNDAVDPIPSGHHLFLVSVIDGCVSAMNEAIGHYTEACYGNRTIVSQGSINRDSL